jgi:hypothetical protein
MYKNQAAVVRDSVMFFGWESMDPSSTVSDEFLHNPCTRAERVASVSFEDLQSTILRRWMTISK